MSQGLHDKVAIVTGGARGIGSASVRALVHEGAAVVITDVLDDEGEALARELCAEGANARYAHLDVSSEEQWQAVVDRTVRDLGHVDVLVNNAGIGTMGDVEQETREGWDRLIAINQTGVWLGMKAVIPGMKANGGGSIVNLSSIFGAVGGFGGSIAYHASKGAVRLMTKNAAIRYAKEGIRVNSVHPASSTRRCWPRSRGHPSSRRWSMAHRWGGSGDPRRSAASSPSWPAMRPAT